jgi:hypothetical protein
MIGCSVSGNPKTGCTAVPVKAMKAVAKAGKKAPQTIALIGGKDGKYCADEPNGIRCNRTSVQGWEKFQVLHLGGNKLALKGGRAGKYCADEGNRIICNRGAIGGWEKFTFSQHGGKIALKGGKGGKYCADEGTRVICNRGGVGGWEKFSFKRSNQWGAIAAKAVAKVGSVTPSMSTAEARCYLLRYEDLRKAFGNNTYKAKRHWKDHGFKEKRNKSCGDMKVAIGKGSRWCADEGNRMLCNRGAIGGWEKQTLRHVKDGKYFAIKGGRNQKYCADETNKIRCNRGGIGGWEKFKITPRNSGGIVMKGGKKKRWCKLVGGAIRCNTYQSSKRSEFKMKNL